MSAADFARIRVFVASPGDVATERAALGRVIKDVNLAIDAFAPGRAIVELLDWEVDSHGGMGRAQGVINRQIGDYDFLVGMMWRRFGTPTGVAGSGTEEEFRRAYASWEESGKPEILFYFSQQEAPPPESSADAKQLTAVLEFREELEQVGLVKLYPDAVSFADVVRRDLLLAVGRMLHGASSAARTADRLGAEPALGVDAGLERQLRVLAGQYARIRDDMERGDARTFEMELVAARMRGLAADLYPLLGDMAASASAGERLAAVMFLQAVPNHGYLEWLAERFEAGTERAFVQYHAGVALLEAVRALAPTHPQEVAAAVREAQRRLGDPRGRDRDKVLDRAVVELKRRLG